jgi:hypothetical protein
VEARKTPTLLGPLERAKLRHYKDFIVKAILQPTVSRPDGLVSGHHLGIVADFYFRSIELSSDRCDVFLYYGAHSLTRARVCQFSVRDRSS